MNTRGNFLADFSQTDDAIVCYGYISDFSEQSLLGILDMAEKARADKFYQTADRIQYITCRAVLKLLLSQFMGTNARDIHLRYTPNGKPMMPGMNAIQFNVSHCRNIIMWGISNGSTIGVDVEHMESRISQDTLASVCSEAELSKIHKAPDHLRHECLINCWTRKEALLKAFGSLSFPLQQIDVSMENEKIEVLATPGETEEDEWYLRSVSFPGDYRGAVAIKGKVSRLNTRRLSRTLISRWQEQAPLHTPKYSSIQFVP